MSDINDDHVTENHEEIKNVFEILKLLDNSSNTIKELLYNTNKVFKDDNYLILKVKTDPHTKKMYFVNE
ncbi:hypothetical protein [Alphaentomopoxvirus acuprea]|uniref:Uncharacterized protein n=1 Tax=Alphaentomopoxvirus acuprea TaxID=62099 RepID=W6JKU9_9POXV|nr:hypothetical protein BA82_gp055 [Anomala cuprea entomopoxvirus]BAO49415.1 hypothetical protein [Anomala cuprea entomopoxvirus]